MTLTTSVGLFSRNRITASDVTVVTSDGPLNTSSVRSITDVTVLLLEAALPRVIVLEFDIILSDMDAFRVGLKEGVDVDVDGTGLLVSPLWVHASSAFPLF